MPRTLLTEVVRFREETFTVRELTARESAEWSRLTTASRGGNPDLILPEAIRLGLVEPKLSTEELLDAPSALVQALAKPILAMSGLLADDEKKATS